MIMSDDADLTSDNFKKSKDLDKATLELIEFIINSHTKNKKYLKFVTLPTVSILMTL
jgi:hypothetical protein